MEPLAEVPGWLQWLQAAGWGALSASGLLIGAVGGYYTSLQHTSIARAMTFAAGVLLAVVAVDLLVNARGAASLHWTVTGLLCGAAVFSSVNWLLSRRGAQHRKRCGECVEQPEEEQQPGSGLAIAAGTFLDGVPEGVVLGLSVLHHGAPGVGTVAAGVAKAHADVIRGTVEAFAAGAILALVSETMIPEAFHGSPQFNGLLLVVGFVALLILLVLSH